MRQRFFLESVAAIQQMQIAMAMDIQIVSTSAHSIPTNTRVLGHVAVAFQTWTQTLMARQIASTSTTALF
jgi:hypothetical protein